MTEQPQGPSSVQAAHRAGRSRRIEAITRAILEDDSELLEDLSDA